MRIWFITGVSSGFGRAIAEAALAAGDVVAGSVRKESDRAAFEALAPGRAHGVLLDVTDEAAIPLAIDRIEWEIGAIGILINNAGYGHEGLVEESTMDELRRQFDANVFGAVATIKAVLPRMRARRAGHILNITSMGGLMTMPGLAYYHGSKFALEGISESLGKEVKHLGIHVTAIEPGSFRTDWAGRSMVRAARSIADYDALMDPIRERRQAASGRQLGDPARLAAAVMTLVAANDPPAHLLLGSDASRLVAEKLAGLNAEFEAWEEVTLSTDMPV
ncbi:oxidoreductase [Sphingomonas abietis]|uniref:Oxidoreductase n=1 Tax=Sphingomonas abietis TaxID=3012344 RepID=A0ABY7NRX9_9SPHN|nr:oxidoreductase [Sphingomonas abietis]WBO23720.1 oxidoreductase [Sphingomonas abietis]